ncbi:MAG: N-acyl homoserine lactonase family protein [Actinomycetota bacterium]
MTSTPDASLPQHRIVAIKYADRAARRPEHFIGGDPHDEPMDMDYFVWAVIGPERIWVVDTGFDRVDAEQRQRNLIRTAAEGLALIDIDATSVTDVVLTHLHYDHVGGFAQFPAARFHVQDAEMAYATGRHMTWPAIRHAYTADHVAQLVHLVYGDRVVFHDGDVELAPGLSLHHIGGHTMGLQVVRVSTAVGHVVLASDANHYYENAEGRPFPIVHDVGAMLAGHERCRALATHPSFVVPGHDPLVFERYPAVPGLEGIAVAVDGAPLLDGAASGIGA